MKIEPTDSDMSPGPDAPVVVWLAVWPNDSRELKQSNSDMHPCFDYKALIEQHSTRDVGGMVKA